MSGKDALLLYCIVIFTMDLHNDGFVLLEFNMVWTLMFQHYKLINFEINTIVDGLLTVDLTSDPKWQEWWMKMKMTALLNP